MAPFVGKKSLSCRKSPRKNRESETANCTKKIMLKVTIGEPKAIIQDIFTNNIPEAIIDVEDEEITFNFKKGTPILITKRGCTKKTEKIRNRRPCFAFSKKNQNKFFRQGIHRNERRFCCKKNQNQLSGREVN